MEDESIVQRVENRIHQAEIDLQMACLVAEYEYWDSQANLFRVGGAA